MKISTKKNIALILFSIVAVIVILNSCKNESTTTDQPKGLELMVSNCYTCHHPEGKIDKRIAPPMIAIKRHYLEEETTKEAFVNDIVNFVSNPTKEKSKMPGALKKFGLMPNMSYPTEQVRRIAEYLYDNEIETPDWFEKHYNEEHQKELTEKPPYEVGNYKEMGMHFALTTKSQLGKNLMNAIKTKGTEHAVEFCNTRAYPLTDSMAMVHQASIKRVSDRPRNPDNQANETELKHINTFKAQLAAGEETKPIVEEKGNKVYFYAPIKTNDMCMQCHGEPKKSVAEKIVSLYPDDKATGYSPNQVRGIWSIQMNKVE